MSVTSQDPAALSVFCVIVVCWVIFLSAFVIRMRRLETRETRQDGTAVLGMSLQFTCYLAVWLPWLQREHFTAIVPMPQIAEWMVAAVTIGVAVASIWLVDAASRRLGKQWALAARLVEGHDLITDGPYRWIRNPIYLGMLGLLVATGLAMSDWMVLMFATALFVVGTMIRIRSEERLLRQAFGTRFDEYARRVPALIPGLH